MARCTDVEALIEKMDYPDTDFRFMALNDLIIAIQNGSLNQKALNCRLVKKTLELLRDHHGEVQSLAVNAISSLFLNVVETQAVVIVDEIVAGMCVNNNERYNGICVMTLKSLVNSTPPENGKLVSILIEQSVPSLVEMICSDSGGAVQVESCEILGDFVSRFGEALLPFKPHILKCMFHALNSPQPSLRKRAVQAITNFLVFEDAYAALLEFVKERFNRITNLLDPVSQKEDVERKNQHELTMSYFKVALQCLVALARNAECLASQASDLVYDKLILRLLDTDINEDILPRLKREFGDPEPEDSANDFRELGLQCLDCLLRARQRTATQSSHLSRLLDINFDKIASVLASLVRYDPNLSGSTAMEVCGGSGDEGENGDTEEEVEIDNDHADDDEDGFSVDMGEEEEDEDDLDSSWKVRRSAAKVIDTFIQSYPEKLGNFYVVFSPVIVNRLSEERNELARLELFNCMNTLLRATTLKNPNCLSIKLSRNTPQVLLLRLMPVIFDTIHQFINAPPVKRGRNRINTYFAKTTPASRQAALGLIRGLAIALPGRLTDHMKTIVGLVDNDFRDVTAPNSVKIELIKLLQLIVKTHEYNSYQQYLETLSQLTLSAVSDPFYRVCFEGMELAQILVQSVPPENFAPLTPLFPAILKQLKVNKCDYELKEKAMTTTAAFIEYLGQDLNAESLQECLDQLTLYLNNESTRIPAIRALSVIFASPLSISTCPVSRDTMKTLLRLVLANDCNLRVAAIHCVTVICSNFPRNFILSGDKNVDFILPLLPQLISDPKPAVAQETLELAAVLLKQCSRADETQQAMVADFYTGKEFLGPVVKLANSNLHQSALSTALLHLMQSIGMYRPQNHTLCVKFMLEKLVKPLQDIIAVGPSEAFSNVKETLPTLARVCAELILQLPRYGQLNSIDSTLEDMVAELKKNTTPYAKRYLYVIIFGDVGYRIDISHRGDVFDCLMDHVSLNPSILPETVKRPTNLEATSSMSSSPPVESTSLVTADGDIFSELRPLAATSLSRLIAGEPATLIHELLQFFHQEYEQNLVLFYLFQTLRQTIMNLVELRCAEYIYRNVEEIWNILMSNAEHAEEGTRNTVSECLGRITLLQPQELIPRLHSEMKSRNSTLPVLCTLVTAFKFLLSVAASINYPDDENSMASVSDVVSITNASVTTLNDRQGLVQILLEEDRFLDVLSHILDADADVCRAALITFNTAAHYWPTLIRPLLCASIGPRKKNLLEEVYQCTTVRQELVRVVEMGPFKLYFDDGVELRKTAYECMSTLLESYADRLSLGAFLEPLINGLKDNNHVKLAVCHILRRLVQLAPIDVVERLPDLAQALIAILQFQPKGDLVKQESEKLDEVKTCALTVVAEFLKLPDIRKNQHFCDLMKVIRADKSLTSMWTDVVGCESSSLKF